MSDALERMRAATEYFNWPLGDKQTQAHIRDLVHAADEFERALTECRIMREAIENYLAVQDNPRTNISINRAAARSRLRHAVEQGQA